VRHGLRLGQAFGRNARFSVSPDIRGTGLAAVPSIGRASLVEPSHVAPQAAATEGLYERHAAKLQSYCLHQLGSREEAEDAVQTTYMNAFRALGRGIVPEAESAWLFKIAENVCLSRRRSSWRRGRIESPSDFEIIEEIIPGPSRQNDELIGIEDALASMPEQQRRAILLREWQGLSYREIAEELEVTQSAVETLIFRARRSLAAGLEQPESVKKPKRKGFRRALHAFDIGTVAAAFKALLAGSAAVKATAAAVAVTAAATTAYGVEKIESKPPVRAAAPAKTLVSKPVSTASVAGRVSTASSSVRPAAAAPKRAVKPAAKYASARSTPAAVAVVKSSAPLHSTPAGVTPVEAARAAPVAAAAEPASDQASAPAAEPSTDEGKNDSSKRVEPVPQVDGPVVVPTAPSATGSPTKAEPVADVQTVTIVPTPAPAVVTNPAPAPVTDAAPAAPTPVATTGNPTTVQPVPGPGTN
jgi:RNA polymerase sigma factor (sigma-70 family)